MHYLVHVGAEFRIGFADVRDRLLDMRHQFLQRVLAFKWTLARQQLINNHSQRIHVGAAVHIHLAASLLGRHITRRPDHVAGSGQILGGIAHPGDAKVGDKGVAFLVDHDVRGLEIPVHDPLAVGIIERRGHLVKHVQHFLGRKPVGLHHLLEGAALQEAHHNVRGVVRSIKVIDRQEVGVF